MAMTAPSERQDARRTSALWPDSSAACVPSAHRHTRAVVSSAALTIDAPSGEKATSKTRELCPYAERHTIAAPCFDFKCV